MIDREEPVNEECERRLYGYALYVIRPALQEYGRWLDGIDETMPLRHRRKLFPLLARTAVEMCRNIHNGCNSDDVEGKVVCLGRALQSLSETTAYLRVVEQYGYQRRRRDAVPADFKGVYASEQKLRATIKEYLRMVGDSEPQVEDRGAMTAIGPKTEDRRPSSVIRRPSDI